MSPKDNRESIVYMAVNLINGKRYIGITCERLSSRKGKHHYDAKKSKNTLIAKAIRKYGMDNLRFDVLSRWQTYDQAKTEEIRLIAELKPEYNLTAGGDGATGYRHSKENIELMSSRSKGRPGYWKGKKIPQHVADILAKIRNARSDKKQVLALGPLKTSKKVICLDDGKVFASISEAARFYGVANSSISNVCSGVATKTKGMVFRFMEQGFPEEPAAVRQKMKSAHNRRKSRKIVCLNDGRMFDGITAAAMFYDIKATSISVVCHRSARRLTAGGMVFRFFGDHHGGAEEADRLKRVAKESQRRGLGPNYRKGVVCRNDSRTFETVKSCAEYYNLSPETIIKSCRGRHRRGSFSGLSFAYDGANP